MRIYDIAVVVVGVFLLSIADAAPRRISDVSPVLIGSVLLGPRQLPAADGDSECSDCGPGECCGGTTCIWDEDENFSCVILRTTTLTRTVTTRRTIIRTAGAQDSTTTLPTVTTTATTTAATAAAAARRKLAARQEVLWTTVTSTATRFIKPDATSFVSASGGPVTVTPVSTVWHTSAEASTQSPPPSVASPPPQDKKRLGVILGGVLAAVFIVGVLLVFSLIWWNKRQRQPSESEPEPEPQTPQTPPHDVLFLDKALEHSSRPSGVITDVRDLPSVLPPSPVSVSDGSESVMDEYVVSPITPMNNGAREFPSFGTAITRGSSDRDRHHARQLSHYSIPRKPVPIRIGSV